MIKEYYQIKIEKNVLIPVSEVESSDEAKEIITKAKRLVIHNKKEA